MKKLLQIRPVDSLLIRDGRPFDNSPGIKASSMNQVPSSVVAGTIRTLLGKSYLDGEGDRFKGEPFNWIKKSIVRGPLYEWGDRVFYPIPTDISFELNEKDKLQARFIVPCKLDEDSGYLGTGKEGRHENMWPPVSHERGGKARKVPGFISAELLIDWLCGHATPENWREALDFWAENEGDLMFLSAEQRRHMHFLSPFTLEERIHVAIDPETYLSKDQALFATEMLVMPDGMTMLAEVESQSPFQRDIEPISTLHSIGGKRRLAQFTEIAEPLSWLEAHAHVRKVKEALQVKKAGADQYVKMVLVTPAYFAKGWKPRWLDDSSKTTRDFNEVFNLVMDDKRLVLQLRWACVDRWLPISGWRYSDMQEKQVRRMVPAGSVFFFQVLAGDPTELIEMKWLAPMSDANRRKGSFDKEDGFGLAVWGVWEPGEIQDGIKEEAE